MTGVPRASAGRSSAGLTIVELLVVIAILAVIMGIGVGVWSTLRTAGGRQGGYLGLLAACRRARIFSLEESAPSRLVLTRRAGQPQGFHAEGLRLVGFWHLEAPRDRGRPDGIDPLVGFAGRRIEVQGGEFYNADGSLVEGRHGTGLSLEGGGGVLFVDEDLTLPSGGRFSFWFLPSLFDRKQRLLSRGRELEFWMAQGGRLEAAVGTAQLSTEEFVLSPGPWHRIDLDFSPDGVSISVDGAVRAASPAGEPVGMPPARESDLPLEMGSGEWQVFGVVDELAVYRAVREAVTVLPEGFALQCDVDVVHFDNAGMLDRQYHNGPVRLGLSALGEGGKPQTRFMTIGLTGEISGD